MVIAASVGALPCIPVIDLRYEKLESFLTQEVKRLEQIYSVAQNHYGMGTLKIGDFLSRRWLKRNNNSYLDEIDLVHIIAPHEGAYMLNLSYEWSCTTCTDADPNGAGNRMLRTLDWPLDGLGRNLIVLRRKTPAGDYWDVTWPGFVGIVTAMAPGRFSAAINQPPMRLWTSSYWSDWIINRSKVWLQRALPPSHLLRKTFDNCRNYSEAKQMLTETPLAIPAFFSLSGIESDESCLIERTEKNAIVTDQYRLLKIDTLNNSPISMKIQEKIVRFLKTSKYKNLIFSDFRHGIFNINSIDSFNKATKNYKFKAADSQVASRWGNITDYKNFDLITPNEKEARFSTGDQDGNVRNLTLELFLKSSAKNIILKLGERGIYSTKPSENQKLFYAISLDSFVEKVVDPVGAGDALLAYASLSYSVSSSIEISSIIGSVAAAIETELEGNVPVSSNDIINRLKKIKEYSKYKNK